MNISLIFGIHKHREIKYRIAGMLFGGVSAWHMAKSLSSWRKKSLANG